MVKDRAALCLPLSLSVPPYDSNIDAAVLFNHNLVLREPFTNVTTGSSLTVLHAEVDVSEIRGRHRLILLLLLLLVVVLVGTDNLTFACIDFVRVPIVRPAVALDRKHVLEKIVGAVDKDELGNGTR